MPGLEVVSASPLGGLRFNWREGEGRRSPFIRILTRIHPSSPRSRAAEGATVGGAGGVRRFPDTIPGLYLSPWLSTLPVSLTTEVLGRAERAGGAFMPRTPTPGWGCWEACFLSGELQVGRGRGALLPLKLLQAPPEPVLGRSLVSI